MNFVVKIFLKRLLNNTIEDTVVKSGGDYLRKSRLDQHLELIHKDLDANFKFDICENVYLENNDL